MSELNPFIIGDREKQAIYRQCADREAWIVQCLALGADRQALEDYDQAVVRYATTTFYPKSDVIAYCRYLARAALERGEPLPASP